MCFFHFFSRFRKDVREFCCRFWTPFRHEIRCCFAVSDAHVGSSFCTYCLIAQKVTLDTAACGLELPKALLASFKAIVFCCFASACQKVILEKVTFDTTACGLELPMALLACLSAMVFCCFASAFRSSFGTGFIPEAWPEGTVAAFWTSFHFAVSEAPFWQETRLSPEEVVDITHELGHASGLQQEWHLTRNCRFRAAETIWT